MKHPHKLVFSLVSFVSIACGQTQTAPTQTKNPATAVAAARPRAAAFHKDLIADLAAKTEAVCPAGSRFRCKAHIRLNKAGKRFTAAAASGGYGPSDIQAAYALASATGGATVALVDAYDYPGAESDLAAYRSNYGLPPCTTANGCFKKVNQNGQTSPLPAAGTPGGWDVEAALDLDSVSAACPSCKIILVEADDDQGTGLYVGQNGAVTAGATIISNSWGGPEDNTDTQSDAAYFTHSGVTTLVASGDDGFEAGTNVADYPSSSPLVVAVGGTSLNQDSSSRGYTETVWDGTGSGCSAFESKPSYQANAPTSCANRATNDVAAVADPNTGFATYNAANGGWIVVGGTSLSSPITAGIIAATGHAGVGPEFFYTNSSDLYDVTSGSNGSCSPSILCNAAKGWDGPTGYGTPNGAAMLGASGGTTGGGSGGSSGGSTGGSSGCQSDSDCPSGEVCNADGTCSAPSGGTCDHDICAQGDALVSSCDPCAQQVCAADSYCCNDQWDSVCVGEVTSVCGLTCGAGGGNGGSGGSCDHDEFTTGDALSSSCDPCSATVCSSDTYCCNDLWDSVCVDEASNWCDASF